MSGEEGLLAEIDKKLEDNSKTFNEWFILFLKGKLPEKDVIELSLVKWIKQDYVLAVLGEAEKHLRELFDKRPVLLVTRIVNEPISEKLFNDLMKASTEIDEYFYKAEKRVFGDKQP